MALPAIPNYNYMEGHKNWTKTKVTSALGPSHVSTVQNLFQRARQLCESRNLTGSTNEFKGEKGEKSKLDGARVNAANELLNQFGPSIQIVGYPKWAAMMCIGVIKYQGGSGMPSKIRATPSNQRSQSVNETNIESSPGSSSTANPKTSTSSSDPETVSTSFAFNIVPGRIGTGSVKRKILLRNLPDVERLPIVDIVKLRLQALKDLLQADLMYSSDVHTLQYYDGKGKVGLINDRDFHNAVYLAVCRNETSLDIHVDEAEDLVDSFLNVDTPTPIPKTQTSISSPSSALGSSYSWAVDAAPSLSLSQGVLQRLQSQIEDQSKSESAHTSKPGTRSFSQHDSLVHRSKKSVGSQGSSKGTTKRAMQKSNQPADQRTFSPVSVHTAPAKKRRISEERSTEDISDSRSRDIETRSESKQRSESVPLGITIPEPKMSKKDVTDEVDADDWERRLLLAQNDSKMEQTELWPECERWAKITPNTTKFDSTIKIPGMKTDLLHSQLLAVFTVLKLNGGIDQQFGAMVGDDPSLGKTFIGMAIAVVRQLALQQWGDIFQDWYDNPEEPKHCTRDAPQNAVCPSDEASWCQCYCEPSSALHNTRPRDGPTLFLALNGNVANWMSEIRQHVDLDLLKVKLAVCHEYEDDETKFTEVLKKQVTTIQRKAVTLPRYNAAIIDENAVGSPRIKSQFVWLLSTWQSAETGIHQELAQKHTYINKKEGKKTQLINRFHPGLVIVDEFHCIKTVKEGPWKALEEMLALRPKLRFWFAGLSGTFIESDPSDLAGIVSVMSTFHWSKDSDHKFHRICPEALMAMKNVIKKYKSTSSPDSQLKLEAESVFETFAMFLPKLGIKRGENSLWFGDPLIKLPKLITRSIKVTIPDPMLTAVNSLVVPWAESTQKQLEIEQESWDKNQHNPSFLAKYPDRPKTIDSKKAFDNARMLRTCSSLPALASLHNTIKDQKWTTAEIERVCQQSSTGQMNNNCWLYQHYPTLVKENPKIAAISNILSHHRKEKVLIFSDFPEFLMTTMRFIQKNPSLSRKPRMYFGSKRTSAVHAFMATINLDTEKPYEAEEADVLLGKNREMGIALNLTKATIVILCEPIYSSSLVYQISRRAYQYVQTQRVIFYTLQTNTMIEKIVDDKRVENTLFTEETFRAMIKEVDEGNASSPIEIDK